MNHLKNEEYYEGDMDFAPEIPEVGEDRFEDEQELLDDEEIFGNEDTFEAPQPEEEEEILLALKKTNQWKTI